MQKRLYTILYYLLLSLSTIAIVIALKIYVFATFSIPSPSMSPAIIPGDNIWVCKLSDKPEQRNEVWVFNFPYSGSWDRIKTDYRAFYVKRCIGLPGDTLSIVDGIYLINNIADTLGYVRGQEELQSRDSSYLASMGVVMEAFPRDDAFDWTIKNFGQLYIPKAGTSVNINAANIKLYKNIIEYETGFVIHADSLITLNSNPVDNYTFKYNYYFMAGDNVLDSKDSRYWGLLPEDHFVGKVSCLWKSKDPYTNEYRFSRFFKSVDLYE